MKTNHLPLVVLCTVLVWAGVAPADTVYYEKAGGFGIETVHGTIVREEGGVVEIEVADGKVLSIPRSSVFQIVRDKKEQAPPAEADATGPGGAEDAAEGEAEVTAGDSSSTVESTTPPPTAAPTIANPDSEILRGTSFAAGDDPRRASRSSGSGRTYHYGLKGGMNMSNMSVDPGDLEESDSLTGFALGAWAGLPLNRSLSLQAEALYSVKGDSESAGGYTTSTRMAYIDVPVVAKVGFLHGKSFQPSLFAGPSVGINVSAKSSLEGEDLDTEVDVKDDVNTFDVGLVLGGGVDFALGERTLGLELRYSKGLTNVAGEGANGEARNDVLAIMGSIGLQ